MSTEILKYERKIVEDIFLEFFQVADGWTQPKHRFRSRSKRINRKVYAWKLRKSKTMHTKTTERPWHEPIHLQGLSLLADINHGKNRGFQNLDPRYGIGSIFVALTPAMLERIVSTKSRSLRNRIGREEMSCKKPFDMLKSGRAKLYFWDGVRICTLGGKILATI